AAAVRLTISAPLSVSAGVPFTITVTALDAFGNVAKGYLGAVAFTSSDPRAALPPNYTFTSADAGVHTFTITLNSGGTQSLTVADTIAPSINGTDSGITVAAASSDELFPDRLIDSPEDRNGAPGLLDDGYMRQVQTEFLAELFDISPWRSESTTSLQLDGAEAFWADPESASNWLSQQIGKVPVAAGLLGYGLVLLSNQDSRMPLSRPPFEQQPTRKKLP